MDDRYDVVVAGGGPAGLATARSAAAGGARVLVLERESAFGIPTRSSGGSFIRPLRDLGIPEDLWMPVRELRFLAPAAEASFHYDDPVACVLDVRRLYQWLAEAAAAAGAELWLRSTVTGVTVRDDGAELAARRGGSGGGESVSLGAHWAVDATGTAAVLAAATGMHSAYERRGVGAEVDLAAPLYPEGVAVLAVGEALAPSGYAWAFPYRPGRVRLGVGVMRPDAPDDPRDFLDAARDLPGLRDWLAGAQPVEQHAGIIPVAPLREHAVSGRLVLVGDAASHASTLAGEGIRYAIGAGDAAGAALATAVRGGGGATPLRAWEAAWRRRHRRDFAAAYRINRVLTGFDDTRWNRAVETLGRTPPWFVAAALSTDLSPRTLLRLAARHPRIALRLARAA